MNDNYQHNEIVEDTYETLKEKYDGAELVVKKLSLIHI